MFEVTAAYSPAKETEIRSETVLAASYDAISRPATQTHVKIGLSILAIDELVRILFHLCHHSRFNTTTVLVLSKLKK